MFTLTGPATQMALWLNAATPPPPPQTHRILKFVVDSSFRLGTILPIVGSILDPSYEMWE